MEFLCGTFMIDHKISKQQTPANHGMLARTEKLKETTHLMGSCGKIEKTGKISKKSILKSSKDEPQPPQKTWRLLKVKIQQLQNNFEENIINLDNYWNKIAVICQSLYKVIVTLLKYSDLTFYIHLD